MNRREFVASLAAPLLFSIEGTSWVKKDLVQWAEQAIDQAQAEDPNADMEKLAEKASELMHELVPKELKERIKRKFSTLYNQGLSEDEILARMGPRPKTVGIKQDQTKTAISEKNPRRA